MVQVTQFLDSDECTQLDDVRIGYVCCGQSYTVAVSESGSEVFACGSSECGSFGTPLRSGDHHRPYVSLVNMYIRVLFVSRLNLTPSLVCMHAWVCIHTSALGMVQGALVINKSDQIHVHASGVVNIITASST